MCAFTLPNLLVRPGPPPTMNYDALHNAVVYNDLNTLKSLIKSGEMLNSMTMFGEPLLHYVLQHKAYEIFNYIMNIDGVNVDVKNDLKQTPLLYLARKTFNKQCALELIRKGANINAADRYKDTFLHLAVRTQRLDHFEGGQFMIEMGCDINAQNLHGQTPLFVAVEVQSLNWAYMLLYYGADPNIPSHLGILPVAVVPPPICDELIQFQEILFNFTFDSLKVQIRLGTLVVAMALDNFLFCEILENSSNVIYDQADFRLMSDIVKYLKPAHLKLFCDRFPHIVKEIINETSLLCRISWEGLYTKMPHFKIILGMFLRDEFVADFILKSHPSDSVIGRLIETFNKPSQFVDEEEVTRIICIMLSHGLNVTSRDLNVVYKFYGVCDLLQILLHMDATIDGNLHPMIILYCKPNTDLKVSPDNFVSPDLLEYFNNRKLKKLCLFKFSTKTELVAKIKSMPQIPHLVELARNVARKYLVNKYRISTSKEFFKVLNCLPIGEMNKQIISLQRKLY